MWLPCSFCQKSELAATEKYNINILCKSLRSLVPNPKIKHIFTLFFTYLWYDICGKKKENKKIC